MIKHLCDMCGKPIGKVGYCMLSFDNYCDYDVFESILDFIRGNRRYDLCFNCSKELVQVLRERCVKRSEEEKEND